MRQQRLAAAASSAALAQQGAAQPSAAAAQQGGEERVALRLRCLEGGTLEPELVAVQLEVQPPEGPAAAASRSQGVPLPQLPATLAALAAAGTSSGLGSLEPQLLQQAAAAVAQLAQAQGVALPALGPSAAEGSTATAAAVAAPAAHVEGGGAGLQEQCNALQLQVARLQAELEAARHDADFARDAAERKQAEMRGRFQEAQQRQSEVLRVAQDSRLDAGGRGGAEQAWLHGLAL